MRLDRSETIAGQPVMKVRDFLRRMDNGQWKLEHIAEHFNIGRAEAEGLVANLIQRDLLAISKPWPHDPDRAQCYEHGEAARRFSLVKFLKPLDRARADALVKGLLDRVDLVNASKEFLFVVAEARVFGSYIDPSKSDFADVDVSIVLARRHQHLTQKEHVALERKRAADSGRRFGNILQEFVWPHEEVLRFLKARKQHLSFHPMSDLEALGVESRVIFSNGSAA